MDTIKSNNRVLFIDIARFYAMALVFYGHFIERIMYLKNPVAADHYKFVYSFHMVLFIILSGYVARQDIHEMPVLAFLKKSVLSRLLPFLFFTLVFMIPPIFFAGDFFNLVLPSAEGYMAGFISSLFGIPMFCVPTWFLLLIFSVEVVHFIAYRFIKGKTVRIIVGMFGFYAFGYWLNWQFDIFNPMEQRVVGYNYLFIHEAICLYGFYLFGTLLSKKQAWIDNLSAKTLAPITVGLLLITYFTYDLNQGPFDMFNSVVIFISSHGHPFWFPFTAISGSLFIVFLARLSPQQKTIIWLGQHSLILMATNGIFYHYVNGRMAQWSVVHLSGSPLSIFGIGVITTVISLMLSVPLVYLFAHYLPQLTGKPKVDGPLLKPLLSS